MAARDRRTSPTGNPGTPGRGQGTPGQGAPDRQESANRGGRLAWIGLAVAAVLAAWQVVYAVAEPSSSNPDVLSSVWLLLSLVLAVGAVVLGIVALGQRAAPRWPATAALAVGVYAFVVSVASWVGDLMAG